MNSGFAGTALLLGATRDSVKQGGSQFRRIQASPEISACWCRTCDKVRPRPAATAISAPPEGSNIMRRRTVTRAAATLLLFAAATPAWADARLDVRYKASLAALAEMKGIEIGKASLI